jgi:hypothetical protein
MNNLDNVKFTKEDAGAEDLAQNGMWGELFSIYSNRVEKLNLNSLHQAYLKFQELCKSSPSPLVIEDFQSKINWLSLDPIVCACLLGRGFRPKNQINHQCVCA